VTTDMRTVLSLIVFTTACWADSTFGTWKMDATRSTFAGGTQPKSLIVRIEPHAKGEVFTLDRVESDGRTMSSSTVLYFDGAPREFEDFGCSGTQSSGQLDAQTTEILRVCASGEWMRLIWRASPKSDELVLEITEQSANGRRFDRRLTLERQ
jgi:hypothetical protein